MLRSFIWAAFIVLCAGVSTTSCTYHKKTPPAPYFSTFMDSIFKTTKNAEASIWVVDSLYKVYPDAPVDSRFDFYGDAIYVYYSLKKDYKKAMLYADSQLALVRNNPGITNYYKLYSDANISKADILFNDADYDAAFEYLFEAKMAAEKSGDPCADFLLSYRLGMVMYKTNRFADAAVYFKQAFAEPPGCGEDFGIFYKRQNILNYTAISHIKCNQYDSALLYCNKALGFIAANEKKYTNAKQRRRIETALGLTYGTMAQAYANSNYAKAEALYAKSIGINSQPGHDAGDALQNQVSLAMLYFKNHNMPALFATLQSTKTGLDSLKNPHALTEWGQLQWEYYNEMKDTAKAFAWVLQYNKFREAEETANKKLDKADVIGQIKSLEAEYQIRLLKKENNLKQVYLTAAALLFIMAAAIVLLLLRNWQKTQKNLNALTALHRQVQFQKDELQEALGELEDRNNEKDRIMGIVAHDLRNPIAGISALIKVLTEEQQYDKAQLEAVFGLMQDGCTNSLVLINEILDFAIKGTSGGDTENTPVDISAIAANCVKMMQFKAQEKKQKLKLTRSGAAEIVLADPAKIWRVVSNLITNAVKFSPAGAQIEIATSHIESTVQVAIIDKGIGIPENIRANIFDAHTTAKRAGTHGEKPFGLGLSICRQIIEGCGGKIWFESEVGKGTTFYISLPKQNAT